MDGTNILLIVVAVIAIGAVFYTMDGVGTVLELRITDPVTPGGIEITSLLLDISEVRVHGTGGWMSIREEPMRVDLIALANNGAPLQEVIGEANLDPGHYTQIRLSVDSSQMTLADGTTHVLTIPSRELKLNRGFDMIEGKRLILTLDFDAGTSIHSNAQGYAMRPTVKVIAENVQCIEDADCVINTAAPPQFQCGDLGVCVEYGCRLVAAPCPNNV